MLDSMNDELDRTAQLVDKAREGSEAAFAELVDVHHPALVRFLTGLTGDPETAADIAQDTFVSAYEKLDQLRDDHSFSAWLHQIARNRWRSHLRRQQRIRFFSFDWLFDATERLPGSQIQPDPSLAYPEQRQVQQALNELAPGLREALILNAICGFPSREVAQILDISNSAAQKRIVRASQQFRDVYLELDRRSAE